MHKRMLIFWLIILTFAFLAISACSDDDDDNPTGSTPTFPAQLVGEYAQTSVSMNGVDQDLADFFDWATGTVRTSITAFSGGEETYKEFDAGDAVLYSDSGYIVIDNLNILVVTLTENGNALAAPDTTFNGTWDLTGDLLTLTAVQGADTVIMVNTKQ